MVDLAVSVAEVAGTNAYFPAPAPAAAVVAWLILFYVAVRKCGISWYMYTGKAGPQLVGVVRTILIHA